MSSAHSLTNGRHAKNDAREAPPAVPSIPLSPERNTPPAEASIGALVKDATTHLSTLVRSEVELAKSEVQVQVKKATKGGIFFAVAATVGFFALFVLFITLAEVLDIWLPRSAAFGIVLGLMLIIAGVFAFLGYKRFTSIEKPERAISSVKESAQVVASRGHRNTADH